MKKILLVFGGVCFVIWVGFFCYFGYFPRRVELISPKVQMNDDSVASESGVARDKDSLATVAIYNGTAKIGITGKFAEKVTEKLGTRVVLKQNAKKRDYPRSFVVDIDGEGAVTAKKLASLLDCPLVTIMPEGESTPSADILVILGGDYR